VTGALGHIGSRLIREIPRVLPEAEIDMIDSMLTQRYPSLFNLPQEGRYRFIEGDVLKYDLDRLFDGAGVVVHLAAITDATGSFVIRERVEKENYGATERVAYACLKTSASLISFSSTSVYGTQKDVVDEDCPESDLRPQSPYAETKLREEKLVRRLASEQGLRATLFRFGTIFGISPGMRFHTAVNKFCWQAVLGQPITVWRTAYHQKRPYLDLGDAVRAILFVIQKGIFEGDIYNVLTLNATVSDIVTAIRKNISELKIEFVDAEIMNQLSFHVSSDKFRRLGFETSGDLETGIGETIHLLQQSNSCQIPLFPPLEN